MPYLLPAFSPDSKKIAVFGQPYKGVKFSRKELFLLNTTGKRKKQVTNHCPVSADVPPVFTEDGSGLVITGYYFKDGGMAESLARLAEMVSDPTEKAHLIEAANCFDSPAFFDPVAKNIDDIRTRHAHQHSADQRGQNDDPGVMRKDADDLHEIHLVLLPLGLLKAKARRRGFSAIESIIEIRFLIHFVDPHLCNFSGRAAGTQNASFPRFGRTAYYNIVLSFTQEKK